MCLPLLSLNLSHWSAKNFVSCWPFQSFLFLFMGEQHKKRKKRGVVSFFFFWIPSIQGDRTSLQVFCLLAKSVK